MKKAATANPPRMSDAAVQAKTGKTWPEWFAILDRVGTKKMNHQEIVAFLNQEHGLGPWWEQMVAVSYEQDRGLREKHEKPNGFEISVSRTLPVGAARLFHAWQDEKIRN